MSSIRLLAVLLSLFALAACGAIERADEARELVDTFHADMAAEDYDAIWRDTDAEFREVTSREDFENLMLAIKKGLGKAEETEQVGINMNTSLSGSVVVLTMDTHFEHGRGREIFTFSNDEGKLELVGYNVNSDDLMSTLIDSAAEQSGEEPQAPAKRKSSRKSVH